MDAQPWWKRGAVYQIYPRSFADSDGDGVGDLRGIIARLDHLAGGGSGALGVEAIWLSPFYPSPMADFGYDVSDFCDVDPLFGTMADFDELLGAAHDRGLRVIVDWIPNHTSSEHPWFREARASRENPKRDWYVWRDPAPSGGPPNNWVSSFRRFGSAWTLDEETGQLYLHSFAPDQPDLNWDNPEVEAAMHRTLRFWLDRGVDGFRIDVVHKLGKDPELRDNTDGRRHDEDWPSVHQRLVGIRRVLEEYEDRMAVGEVYLLDQRRLVRYVSTGDELHLVHNFVFLNLAWSAADMRRTIDEFEVLGGEEAWPAWCLSNHDHSRVASRYDDGGHGPARARVAAMLLLTLRGTPFLYQGEELGLPDAPIPPERVVDVDGRDPERAPLPWAPPSQAGPSAGFTTGVPWLPPVPDAEHLNVTTQGADPRSTLSLYRALCRRRAESPALREGAQRSLDAGPDLLAYTREHRDERLLVVLSFSAAPRRLDAPGAGLSGSAQVELSTDPDRPPGQEVDLLALELHPDEGMLLRLP